MKPSRLTMIVFLTTFCFATIWAQKLFLLDCTQSWQNTGVTVNQNDILVITAKGAYSDGTGGTTTLLSWSTADGRGSQGNRLGTGFISDVFPIGALIGKIGTSGTIFGIGSYGSHVASQSGILYLTVNDHSSGFGDNSGSLAIEIVRASALQRSIFILNATQSWQSTSISVNQNERLYFVSKGAYSDGTGGATTLLSWSTADGRGSQGNRLGTGFISDEFPIGALIGKIGTGGTIFGIGSYGSYVTTQSGTLYLSVNDHSSGFGDNSGSLAVDIMRATVITTNVIGGDNGQLTGSFYLDQNFPNPFNPSTRITFSVQIARRVTLKVFDILGKEINTLIDETKEPGVYDIDFHGVNLPSGTYFYTLTSGEQRHSKKMILAK